MKIFVISFACILIIITKINTLKLNLYSEKNALNDFANNNNMINTINNSNDLILNSINVNDLKGKKLF